MTPQILRDASSSRADDPRTMKTSKLAPLILAVAWFACDRFSLVHGAEPRPNLIFLLVDDLRWIGVDEIDHFSFCPADRDILAKLKQTEI